MLLSAEFQPDLSNSKETGNLTLTCCTYARLWWTDLYFQTFFPSKFQVLQSSHIYIHIFLPVLVLVSFLVLSSRRPRLFFVFSFSFSFLVSLHAPRTFSLLSCESCLGFFPCLEAALESSGPLGLFIKDAQTDSLACFLVC